MLIVRDATERDLPGIFAIYDEQVLHGTATFDTEPRAADERLAWFGAHDRGRYPIIVAEDAGVVAGWARLYPWSDRCAYARSAENSVYVHRDWRGRGIGTRLLGELIAHARTRALGVLLARIAEGNPASVRLHERAGFETVGVMRRVGEKFGRVLDVRLMQLHLDGWRAGGGG